MAIILVPISNVSPAQPELVRLQAQFHLTADQLMTNLFHLKEPLKLFISNTISKENFLINYTGDERPPLTMALFNSIGQLVYVQNITESATITTSGYAPGIYYCRIFKNSESVLTEKIVVMK